MSTNANNNIVEFLTTPENLSGALEVIRHGDAIRGVLLSRFWQQLHEQIGSRLPAQIAADQPDWDSKFKPDRMLDKHVFLDLNLKSSRLQKQALTFRVEHETGQRHHDLYFGLHWREPVIPGSSLLTQPEVKAVAARRRELGFKVDDHASWLGWRYVRRYGSLDDFLTEFTEEPESLLEDISKPFAQHVEQVRQLVIEANMSISGWSTFSVHDMSCARKAG